MKRHLLLIVMILTLGLMVTACDGLPSTPGVVTTPELSAPDPANAPQAALRVRDAFAQSMSKAADAVVIVSFEAVDWPDSCLGAAAADEMCASVITPGYRVVVENEGEQYTLHTDASGDAWRVAP